MTARFKSPALYGTSTCTMMAPLSRLISEATVVRLNFWRGSGTPLLLCCMRTVGLPQRHNAGTTVELACAEGFLRRENLLKALCIQFVVLPVLKGSTLHKADNLFCAEPVPEECLAAETSALRKNIKNPRPPSPRQRQRHIGRVGRIHFG